MVAGVPSRRACLSALAGLTLAACGRRKKRTIAVIPKATSHMFWLTVQQGAFDAGRELNVDILWNGPATETDFSRQIQIMDSMIAQHVDGIALAAGDRNALVAPVDRAAAAHIPVTIFDSGLDSTNYVSYVATDNVEAGRAAARALIELLGGKGKVGHDSACARQRLHHGSRERLHRNARFRRSGHSDRRKPVWTGGSRKSPSRRRKYPDSSSRSEWHFCIVGTERRRSLACDSGTRLDGQGGRSWRLMQATRWWRICGSGAIDAMIVQDAHRMGYEAVKTLVDKLNGKTPPHRLDLHAARVQAKDLNEPEVKRLLNLK